jgi:hypothetical protein
MHIDGNNPIRLPVDKIDKGQISVVHTKRDPKKPQMQESIKFTIRK